MTRHRALSACAVALSALLLASGCDFGTSREVAGLSDRVAEAIAAESRAASVASAEPARAAPGSPASRPSLAPAPSPFAGNPVPPVEDTAGAEEDSVTMRILERYHRGNYVYIVMLFRNLSDKGIRKHIYLFGYDRNGRLVETDDNTQYFQPREQILRTYRYNLDEEITRWVYAIR